MTTRRLLLVACFLAGWAVLALETLWIRRVGLVAGRTAVSSAVVLAVFFLFAAAGAWAGGRWAARVKRPMRLCGIAWGAAGLAAVAGLAVELPDAPAWLAAVVWVGPAAWGWAMGFPCLCEVFATGPAERTARCGAFYAADLAGSALGAWTGGVWLPAALGYRLTGLAAGLVLVVAGMIVLAARTRPVAAGMPLPPREGTAAWWPWVIVVLSGFLSVGAEVLAVQWLLLMLPDSVYVVAGVLSGFVVSLAAGAVVATQLRRRGVPSARLLNAALCVSGALVVAAPFVAAPWIGQPVSQLAVLLALTPVVACFGMVFPLAWELVAGSVRHQGTAMGRVVWANKLACAAGAVVVPLGVVPWLGPVRAAVVIGAGYFLLAGWRGWLALPVVAAALAWAPVPVRLWPGERLVDVEYDALGVVATIEDAGGSRHLVLNQLYKLNGTRQALLAQRHAAWLPVTLAARAERVLFIGSASGISAAAALDFPVGELVAAEVVPGVARAARKHFADWNTRLFADPRARVVTADGRRVLRTGRWDVVICDLMLPSAEGTASLYSREFFAETRARLNDGGLFCLWLPLHQLDAATAGIVARTFAEVFPQAVAIRGNFDPIAPILGLVGSRSELDWQLKQAIPESPLLRSAAHLRLAEVGAVRPGPHPVNTDDRPVIAFAAPQVARRRELLRGIRFLEWSSAHLPAANPAALAGQNYFAAAVMSVPLPEPAQQAQRDARAAQPLERARQLWPDAVLGLEDWGR